MHAWAFYYQGTIVTVVEANRIDPEQNYKSLLIFYEIAAN